MSKQPWNRIVVVACWLALCPLPEVQAQGQKRPLTVEDLWQVQRLGQPALSPDGRWAVLEVTTYSMKENGSTSELWLVAADGSEQRQLTFSKGKNSGPIWSPDGKTIAFASNRSGKVSQIFLLSLSGGEARQLSNLPMSPAGLKWTPDGQSIVCIVRTWPDTPDDKSYRQKEKAQQENKVKAFIIDDALFRYWDKWIADGKRPVLFAVDAATGKHHNLFAGLKRHLPVTNPSADAYDISPDGKEICFTSDSIKEIGTDFNLDLYTMPLDQPGKVRKITPDNPASDHSPVYSPDGKAIAFLRQTIKYFYADRVRLMVHDRASGQNREITANFDRSCNPPRWARDCQKLYFEAEDKGYHRLYQVSARGNDVTPLTAGFSDTALDLSRDGQTLAFLRGDFNTPATLWVLPIASQTPRRIDRFNMALASQWKLGKVKEVYFQGADDQDVQMWVVYPPDFDAKKKWPLLQVVHGGPHSGVTTSFHYRWNLQLFAAAGYVVTSINFHGSSGFGQAFTDSITGDMGTKPMIDILKGTDFMEKEPYIDKSRMAAAGASYGGYMMAWLNGHTDRFKAMICHAGVYNWHSMMASDIVRARERPLGALPWGGDLSKIDRQTPQRYAAHFKTPTLVLHGEKDFRVPVTQGFEYYNTLRQRGVPTRLVYFPDENHWIMSPQNSRLWHREFFAWLDKYIGHGPTP